MQSSLAEGKSMVESNTLRRRNRKAGSCSLMKCKKNYTMKNDEFYIGWMEKAPPGFAHHVKKVLLVLFFFITITGLLLALCQKQFATGNFEFGKLTEVKGVYFNEPIPLLKAVNGKDIFGNPSFVTIPLIGFGKSGAEGVIAELEKNKNASLNHKEVNMRGSLLYNDGKLLMQVDANDAIISAVGTEAYSTLWQVVVTWASRKFTVK